MKRLILIVFCLLALPVLASHLVGGEFEIIYVSGSSYKVNLILYFDMLNGNREAKNNEVYARIYRKRDNAMMQDVYLPLVHEEPVLYTQPACSNGEVVTRKLIYTNTITLAPGTYNDPAGYYIVWERCCRNYTITNIISKNPFNFPSQYAGQTFYLEFPPVVKNGEPFINSSPRLFPPLNDYACPNRPYYANFAGTDDNGDSLVYTLVAPLNTRSADALPVGGPRPRPYPDVQWAPTFGLSNIMGGQPDLKISLDGLLTVVPGMQGLFVFAVKCEEFRDKVKIGELRRDFQLLVVDKCPQAEPPQITGKKLTDTDFTDNAINVTFNSAVGSASERCIQVRVSDPDASKQDQNFQEKISLKVIPLNFKNNVNSITLSEQSTVLSNGSTHDFEICFPECSLGKNNGPYKVGIVAYDDACTLPLFDTLKVTVNVVPPPNSLPFFGGNVTATVNAGDPIQKWTFKATDNDGDIIDLGYIPLGFRLQDFGMSFKILQQQAGQTIAELSWDPSCDKSDFSKRTDFEIRVIAEDRDDCKISTPVFANAKLKILLPFNHDPVIDSDLTSSVSERRIENIKMRVYDKFTFKVKGSDLDSDSITLSGRGVGFAMSDYGITFPTVKSKRQADSQFLWNIKCDKIDLARKNIYEFEFIVIDKSKVCIKNQADTLTVFVTLLPPENKKPELVITNMNPEEPLDDSALSLTLGTEIRLGLHGSDADRIPDMDNLRIELIEAKGTTAPEGYVFTPAEGKGDVQTTFVWQPDCSIFANDVYKNLYQFAFRVYDDRCLSAKADTTQVAIEISDYERSSQPFQPGNIITPNGDGCNDYFALEGIDPACGQLDPDGLVSLPVDNCQGAFENIIILNRWGKEVFHSSSRAFRWYPSGEASGIYYYLLKFSEKEFKGTVTVRF